MKVTVHRPCELDEAELNRWRGMCEARLDFQNPFLTPEFALAADRARDCVRVAVLEDDSRICGFWPHSRRRGAVAAPIVPGYTNCEALVHLPGFDWSWRDLLRSCHLAGWRFDSLIAGQAQELAHRIDEVSPLIDLSMGWQEYDTSLHKVHKRRQSVLKQKMRAMRRAHDVSLESGSDHAVLDAMMDLKSAQCRERGWRDVFGPPWARELAHRLLECSGGQFLALTPVLRIDGQLAAAGLNLRFAFSEATWFSVYDVRFAKWSPGIVATYEMARISCADGVVVVDMGKGDESYKTWFSNAELVVSGGTAGSSGGRGALLDMCARGEIGVRKKLRQHPEHVLRARRLVRSLRRRSSTTPPHDAYDTSHEPIGTPS